MELWGIISVKLFWSCITCSAKECLWSALTSGKILTAFTRKNHPVNLQASCWYSVWFGGWRLCREINASHRVRGNCVCAGATPGWFCSLGVLGCRAGFSSSSKCLSGRAELCSWGSPDWIVWISPETSEWWVGCVLWQPVLWGSEEWGFSWA